MLPYQGKERLLVARRMRSGDPRIEKELVQGLEAEKVLHQERAISKDLLAEE